jgi:hypothetical protein
MITRSLTTIVWMMVILALSFARLPNNKGGSWNEEINKKLKTEIEQRIQEESNRSTEHDRSLFTQIIHTVNKMIGRQR